MPLAVAVGPDPAGAEVYLGWTAWCPALVRVEGLGFKPCPWRVLCRDQEAGPDRPARTARDQATELLEVHLGQHRGQLERVEEAW